MISRYIDIARINRFLSRALSAPPKRRCRLGFPSVALSAFLFTACQTYAVGAVIHSYIAVGGVVSDSMGFFKVISDKSTYDKSPQKFEVLKLRSGPQMSESLYIERSPSLTLPLSEILSVTIERRDKYGALARPKKSAQGTKDSGGEILGFVYIATIELTKSGQRDFSNFATKHKSEHFDCRIGQNSLTIAQIVPGITSGRFVLSLGSKDEPQIKTIFVPLGAKLNWK